MADQFRILPSGNIVMTVALMPDAYAALKRIEDAEGLRPVDAVNLAIMTLEGVAEAAGISLKGATAEDHVKADGG